jgi:hypothetical protein
MKYGFTVTDLLNSQLSFQNYTEIPMNLGDGFLIKNNLIFRKIRLLSRSIDVCYSSESNLYNYDTCPNLSFNKILENKTVPYLKNTAPLIEVVRHFPDLDIGRMLEIKKNNILHESTHLVIWEGLKSLRDSTTENFTSEFVFDSLFSEAFACSCETIGQYYTEGPVHRWFYRQNTNAYGCDRTEYLLLLNQLSEQFGIDFCFRLSLFSFLFWNFYYSRVDRDTLYKILPHCGENLEISDSDLSIILSFCNLHFNIHSWFRNEIASFYFYKSGFRKSLAELLNFDFLKLLTFDQNRLSFYHSSVSSLFHS